MTLYGDPRLPARFWKKVTQTNLGCWQWTGGLSSEGYARFGVHYERPYAHRHSFEALMGPIPPGLHIDHLCRNRACVNPDHLEPVTPKENFARGHRWLNKATHCRQGHEFTEGNTYTDPKGIRRDCKKCTARRSREYRARKKQAK